MAGSTLHPPGTAGPGAPVSLPGPSDPQLCPAPQPRRAPYPPKASSRPLSARRLAHWAPLPSARTPRTLLGGREPGPGCLEGREGGLISGCGLQVFKMKE